jgi:hypothetical protein
MSFSKNWSRKSSGGGLGGGGLKAETISLVQVILAVSKRLFSCYT